MNKIETALVAAGKFIASLLDPAARLISLYPKGTLIVWVLSLVLTAWLF